VLHTVNLAEGRFNEMIVNAGLGLGEGIVSGLVAADQIVVSKHELRKGGDVRIRYVTNDKRECVVFDASAGSGTRRAPTLYHQRLRPAMEYVEVCELAAVAARLEAAYRQPLDIEFAIEGTALRLLQLRPVPAALSAWRQTLERYPFDRRPS
jgi:pyruvate,water dikinase